MLGAYGTPVLGEGEVVWGSAMAPLEKAMVVYYRLSIVTVAISVLDKVKLESQTFVICCYKLNH